MQVPSFNNSEIGYFRYIEMKTRLLILHVNHHKKIEGYTYSIFEYLFYDNPPSYIFK